MMAMLFDDARRGEGVAAQIERRELAAATLGPAQRG
jgi:hypothetical protein